MGRGKKKGNGGFIPNQQKGNLGVLSSALGAVGGLGGATSMLGGLLQQNEGKMVNGIKALEKKEATRLAQDNWEGLTYTFSKVEHDSGKSAMMVLLMPYKTIDGGFQMGKPWKTWTLSNFISYMVELSK